MIIPIDRDAIAARSKLNAMAKFLKVIPNLTESFVSDFVLWHWYCALVNSSLPKLAPI